MWEKNVSAGGGHTGQGSSAEIDRADRDGEADGDREQRERAEAEVEAVEATSASHGGRGGATAPAAWGRAWPSPWRSAPAPRLRTHRPRHELALRHGPPCIPRVRGGECRHRSCLPGAA